MPIHTILPDSNCHCEEALRRHGNLNLPPTLCLLYAHQPNCHCEEALRRRGNLNHPPTLCLLYAHNPPPASPPRKTGNPSPSKPLSPQRVYTQDHTPKYSRFVKHAAPIERLKLSQVEITILESPHPRHILIIQNSVRTRLNRPRHKRIRALKALCIRSHRYIASIITLRAQKHKEPVCVVPFQQQDARQQMITPYLLQRLGP